MLTNRHRLIVLYVVLATTVGNIVFSVVTGHMVSDVLYGILGTVGSYVLLRGGDGAGGPGPPSGGSGGEPK